MKKRLFLLLFGAIASVATVTAQTSTLKVKLVGKEYKALNLLMEDTIIKGQSDNLKDWTFTYNDSIYQKHTSMDLRVPDADTILHLIMLYGIADQDTLRFGSFGFPKNYDMTIYYRDTETKAKVMYARGRDVIEDNFVLYNPPITFNEWHEIGFAYSELSYPDQLAKRIALVKERPDSHYLMAMFSSTVDQYETLDDVRKVYDCFTKEQQESYYGQKVNLYLNDKLLFVNYQMPNSVTGAYEPIVVEKTKPTLVIFSASWCAPCTKLIPELKKMYGELKDKMEFVYVSIDEPKTVDQWKEKMSKEQIPWRSLHATSGIKELIETLLVPHVPYALLVNPDLSMERYDIFKEQQRAELYTHLE